MKIVVDAHKAIGKDLKGFGAQAKIHTRNNVGASGKIYFGTKQGYPTTRARSARTTPAATRWSTTRRPARRRSTPSRCRTRASTASRPTRRAASPTSRPAPTTGPAPARTRIFLILDLKTGKYRDLIDTQAHLRLHRRRPPGPGLPPDARRRHRPLRPEDRQARAAEADHRRQAADAGVAPGRRRSGHPINWDISPDGKTLYSLPMSTQPAVRLRPDRRRATRCAGKSLGTLVPGAKSTDCRAMCVGPKGTVWAAVTEPHPKVGHLLHLVSYRPGDKAPRDHGPVSVSNPDFTRVHRQGRQAAAVPRRASRKVGDVTTTKYVILGVCEGARRRRLHPGPASLHAAASAQPPRGP